MKIVKTALVVFALSLLGTMLAPSVQAQDDNAYIKRTIVTFSQPVEIPGQILPAGTYSIELVDSAAYRHIVRILQCGSDSHGHDRSSDSESPPQDDRQDRDHVCRTTY